MGSEVSSNAKSQSLEMEQLLASDQMGQAGEDGRPWRKPARCVLYAEKFYCPLIHGGGYMEATFDHELLPELDGALSSPVPVENHKESEPETEIKITEIPDEDLGSRDFPGDPTDQDIDDKVEEAIAIDAVTTKPIEVPNLGFHLEFIEIPSVEKMDTCTNTSQPTFHETATGNSQPFMVDCATGMSQNLEEVDTTMDVGIQTSQEFPSADKILLPKCEIPGDNEIHQPRKRYAASTATSYKTPIVFPRVSCQTVAPEIPAKMPRLSELDENVVLNSIYSTGVTFDYDEADKENDNSILLQRGNMGKLMRETSGSTSNCSSPSKLIQNENRPHEKLASSSSNFLISSRGPFLRVGLSKKSRTRTPLHPRVFGTERNDFSHVYP